MPQLITVLMVLGLAFAVVWFLINASPKVIAGLVQIVGGIGGLVLSYFLLIRGRFEMAMPLAIFSISLLMGKGFDIFSIFDRKKHEQKNNQPSGNFSEVRTKFLEMKLDHDTGEMDGVVLRGPFSGQRLSRLSVNDIIQLRKSCLTDDQQSVPLLEAFLDHIQPKWREHPDVQPETNENEPQRNDMSSEEAYAILGLNKGATEEDIRLAHRNLMKKFHPDQGGSTYLASKINEAKDLLLTRR